MGDPSSPMPYIKNEPEDQRFMSPTNGFGNMNQQGQQFGNSWPVSMGTIEPSNISINNGMVRPSFGSQQNLSSNFIAGSSAVDDDELQDLINFDAQPKQGINSHSQNGMSNQQNSNNSFGMSGGFFNDLQGSQMGNQQGNFMSGDMYSNTPPGSGPIQSPFMQSFNYMQWGSPQQKFNQQNHMARNGRSESMQAIGADARSPVTPKTPGLGGLQLGTPDSSQFNSSSIPVGSNNHGHRHSASSQWDSNRSSGQSYLDSPLPSPQSGPHHPPIASVMESARRTSVPVKHESVPHSAPSSTAEAKKRRRRESHNAVERRRRDNINDRIQELSQLVPPHRLDDDRLRKQINSTNPYNTAGTGGISPPQATSLLAGGSGRRAAGTITQGLPVDDKDKAPAKGDVLNGAVSWTRDLMWMLHRKIQQESMLLETIESLGGQPPYEVRDDEQRMQTELMAAIERNGASNFEYSRADGSGLWVPKHTDRAGGRLPSDSQHVFESSYLNQDNDASYGGQDSDFWGFNPDVDSRHGSMDFKEDDELHMEIS